MEDIKRTNQQNKSLHKWLTEIALLLREQGLTMKEVMEVMKEYEVKPTMHGLKENVWKPIQESMFGTTSTTELEKTGQIDDVIDVMTKIMACMWITVPPFPSENEKSLTDTYGKRITRISKRSFKLYD